MWRTRLGIEHAIFSRKMGKNTTSLLGNIIKIKSFFAVYIRADKLVKTRRLLANLACDKIAKVKQATWAKDVFHPRNLNSREYLKASSKVGESVSRGRKLQRCRWETSPQTAGNLESANFPPQIWPKQIRHGEMGGWGGKKVQSATVDQQCAEISALPRRRSRMQNGPSALTKHTRGCSALSARRHPRILPPTHAAQTRTDSRAGDP
jgi:hypothetical protein